MTAIDKAIDKYDNINNLFNAKLRKKRGLIKGKIEMSHVFFDKKNDFILNILSLYKYNIIYRILFWESDSKMKDLLEKYSVGDSYVIYKSYNKKKRPGVLFIKGSCHSLDYELAKSILINHFNYELAKKPSLNMRVQIYLDCVNGEILLDIYDDRGLDLYFW
jgi:hypothetical protein